MSDESAFPNHWADSDGTQGASGGLTKREYFTAAALATIKEADFDGPICFDQMANVAVQVADAVMAKLGHPVSVVSRDGEMIFAGSNDECFTYILKHQSQSVDHAMKHEGWAITEVPRNG